jgi:flavin reductase (DIM6/NTAB) family NADH-FMN oxidoreductase RutF
MKLTMTNLTDNMTSENLKSYIYKWPYFNLEKSKDWRKSEESNFLVRDMPENREEMSKDSRWPSFFPSPICIVTTTDGTKHVMEKVVCPSLVNRFPFIMALSYCDEKISSRHYERKNFMEVLQSGQSVAVQFLEPGKKLDTVMNSIANIPDEKTDSRIASTNLSTRKADTNDSLVFNDAYLVYEAKFVDQDEDFMGKTILTKPFEKVGSHKVFFLEVNAIQLREDISDGTSQIAWKSLPIWSPSIKKEDGNSDARDELLNKLKYIKGYNPNYHFPSKNTIAFEKDTVKNGMTIKYLPKAKDKGVILDNNRARWPCFFPSPVCFISSWKDENTPNVMPCGSTWAVSRDPFVISPCISYIDINERYAARASYHIIRKNKKFGCSIPYLNQKVIDSIRYMGNMSFTKDPKKVFNAGINIGKSKEFPLLTDMPINYSCEVIGEVYLGTHVMFLGKVNKIYVRSDLNINNPLEWCPWSEVIKTEYGEDA